MQLRKVQNKLSDSGFPVWYLKYLRLNVLCNQKRSFPLVLPFVTLLLLTKARNNFLNMWFLEAYNFLSFTLTSGSKFSSLLFKMVARSFDNVRVLAKNQTQYRLQKTNTNKTYQPPFSACICDAQCISPQHQNNNKKSTQICLLEQAQTHIHLCYQ